jgi:TRAP-type C4-dicarboxylate transport system permease small subunit
MKALFAVVTVLSRYMYKIAAFALVSIVFLMVADIILRRFRMPIDFAYEIVLFLGAIVIGFSLPQTTLNKRHVIMEWLTTKLPPKWKKMASVGTRGLGAVLFIIFGWNILRMGNSLRIAGQVSPILEFPEYPIAYGIALCCFVQALVLFHDLLEQWVEVKP